jgi:hypothetical protein
MGKYIGVSTFVGFQATLFVSLTWLALGLRTHVWGATYLLSIPLLLVEFAIFYGFSVLLAVLSRSTVACVFGSVLFWLLGWGVNYGTTVVRGMYGTHYVPPAMRMLAELAYWVSPKPIDVGLILFNALDAQHHFEKPTVFKLLEARPGFSPQLSILSSLAITSMLLMLSAHELNAKDY